jgi:hypothetical protein
VCPEARVKFKNIDFPTEADFACYCSNGNGDGKKRLGEGNSKGLGIEGSGLGLPMRVCMRSSVGDSEDIVG